MKPPLVLRLLHTVGGCYGSEGVCFVCHVLISIFFLRCHCTGKQLALLETNSAVRTCGFDFSGNIIMFSTDKQMGYQCYLNFFDLRDPQQIGRRPTCPTPLCNNS